MSTILSKSVSFGSSKAGLLTVGYQLKDNTGANVGSRITAGVFEIGGGSYGAAVTFANDFHGYLVWDTGEVSPRYAEEEINLFGGSEIPPTSSGYVTVAEIRSYLSNANQTYAGTDAEVQLAINAVVGAWEQLTGYQPFLNANSDVTTRFYSLLSTQRVINLKAGLIGTPTAVSYGLTYDDNGAPQGGTALVVNRDYVLKPFNAAPEGKPSTSLLSRWNVWGSGNFSWDTSGERNLSITGVFGYCTSLSADVKRAILVQTAVLMVPELLLAASGGAKRLKEMDEEIEFGAARDSGFAFAGMQLTQTFAQTVAIYRRLDMA